VATALGAVSAIIGFWTRYSDRITKADAKAEAAQKAADEGKAAAKLLEERLGIVTAQFSLYREQAVEKYVGRETLREVEERLTDAIERLGDRFDRAIEQRLHKA